MKKLNVFLLATMLFGMLACSKEGSFDFAHQFNLDSNTKSGTAGNYQFNNEIT
jgi:hypothetical protein